MENLKLALRLRLRRGSLDQTAAETIAAALDCSSESRQTIGSSAAEPHCRIAGSARNCNQAFG